MIKPRTCFCRTRARCPALHNEAVLNLTCLRRAPGGFGKTGPPAAGSTTRMQGRIQAPRIRGTRNGIRPTAGRQTGLSRAGGGGAGGAEGILGRTLEEPGGTAGGGLKSGQSCRCGSAVPQLADIQPHTGAAHRTARACLALGLLSSCMHSWGPAYTPAACSGAATADAVAAAASSTRSIHGEAGRSCSKLGHCSKLEPLGGMCSGSWSGPGRMRWVCCLTAQLGLRYSHIVQPPNLIQILCHTRSSVTGTALRVGIQKYQGGDACKERQQQHVKVVDRASVPS